MYHKNNLGKYSRYVEEFADIEGYVPQEGDTPDQFTLDAIGDQWEDLPESEWNDFVVAAIAATKEAISEIEKWQVA